MWLGRIAWKLVQGVAVIYVVMLLLSHCSSESPAPPEPSDSPVGFQEKPLPGETGGMQYVWT